MSWNSPVASFLRVFVATLLTAVVVSLTDAGTLDVMAAWQTWVAAALIASLPVLVNWLNPRDTRYGVGAGDDD